MISTLSHITFYFVSQFQTRFCIKPGWAPKEIDYCVRHVSSDSESEEGEVSKSPSKRGRPKKGENANIERT